MEARKILTCLNTYSVTVVATDATRREGTEASNRQRHQRGRTGDGEADDAAAEGWSPADGFRFRS